jgi:hypothetical protein
MAIKLNKLYFILIFLLGIVDLFAGPGGSGPPAPTARKPPPPPGLTIDDNAVILILAIFLGIYFIYGYQQKTKTPI